MAHNIVQKDDGSTAFDKEGTAALTFTPDNGVKIGSGGSALKAVTLYRQSITLAGVSAASVARPTATIAGLVAATDVVVGFQPPAMTTDAAVTAARVSANNTMELTVVNPTSLTVTPTGGIYTFTIARREV